MSALKPCLSEKVLSASVKNAHLLRLGFWILLGTTLRFINLTAKPPWTDEFATMAFSLGNSFEKIPFNQVLSAEQFLSSLRVNDQVSVFDIIRLILDQDNHPPLYFILVHWWITWFSNAGEYVSLWGMRSLPALFGVLAIPLIYLISRKLFKSILIADSCAAMMAVSSYGIFIAQEARHYTLAILFVLASLGCFLKAFQLLSQHQKPSYFLIFLWLIINSVGLSIHYFLSLIFVAEGLSLLGLFVYQWRTKGLKLSPWTRLIWVILGTATTGLFWLNLALSEGYGNEMTAWIQRHDYPILGMINPPFQLLAAWITMFTLLPVESADLFIVILSGLAMLLFFLWLIPIARKAIQLSLLNSETQILIQGLLLLIGSLLIVTFTITYGLGIDITRGARYSFIYFPPIIWLIGVILATILDHPYFKSAQLLPSKWLKSCPKMSQHQPILTVSIIWIIGLLGAVTVLGNLGYQKYYLPNRLVKVIEQQSIAPVLVVAPYISLSQTGEIMGIAWEAVHQNSSQNLSFMILKEENTKVYHLPSYLQKSHYPDRYPLEIWPVNFYYSTLKLDSYCQKDIQKLPAINGYNYQRFHCP